MVTIMQNIPRRKIYETMLEYEEVMIELQILLYSEENFQKYIGKVNSDSLKELRRTYTQIKALLVLFFENKKFEQEEDYEQELSLLINDESKSREYIIKNNNLPKAFIDTILTLEKKIKKFQTLDTLDQAQEFYEVFDTFNHYIPKILEIRRDQMR
ncbi:MAG: hypothetical protein VXZ40_03465 [Nanoarchaeota archaeon]|nr:hypothetical protein [Nanoarchaeota archaeon]